MVFASAIGLNYEFGLDRDLSSKDSIRARRFSCRMRSVRGRCLSIDLHTEVFLPVLSSTKAATAVLLIIAAFLSQTSCAESIDSQRGVKSAPSIGDELLSPWTDSRSELLIGTGATFLLLAIPRTVHKIQTDTAEDQPLGKVSPIAEKAGEMIPNALYALGFGLDAWLSSSSRSKTKSLNMVKATAYASAVATLLKYTVREPRPDTGTRNSFPSGHSTTIGAFAGVVLSQENPGYGGGAVALALLVAYSRMNDNRHYVQDVVSGLTIGLTYGLGVGRLHALEVRGHPISIGPGLFPGNRPGLRLGLEF